VRQAAGAWETMAPRRASITIRWVELLAHPACSPPSFLTRPALIITPPRIVSMIKGAFDLAPFELPVAIVALVWLVAFDRVGCA
jgi:hypothetical protein